MAATPESRSKDAAKKVLECIAAALPKTASETHAEGLWWWWIQPGYGQANAPDLIGFIQGAAVVVEFKADPSEGGRPPRPGQVREIEAILAATEGTASWVGAVGDAESFDLWRAWMVEQARRKLDPFLQLEKTARITAAEMFMPRAMHAAEEALNVPWRTKAALTRRPAPPSTAPPRVRRWSW